MSDSKTLTLTAEMVCLEQLHLMLSFCATHLWPYQFENGKSSDLQRYFSQQTFWCIKGNCCYNNLEQQTNKQTTCKTLFSPSWGNHQLSHV